MERDRAALDERLVDAFLNVIDEDYLEQVADETVQVSENTLREALEHHLLTAPAEVAVQIDLGAQALASKTPAGAMAFSNAVCPRIHALVVNTIEAAVGITPTVTVQYTPVQDTVIAVHNGSAELYDRAKAAGDAAVNDDSIWGIYQDGLTAEHYANNPFRAEVSA